MTDPDEELDALRIRIDELDRAIVRLLNERAALALEAGRAKAAAGRDGIRDHEREREVLLRIAMANEGPLPQADLLEIYRAIIDALERPRGAGPGGPGLRSGAVVAPRAVDPSRAVAARSSPTRRSSAVTSRPSGPGRRPAPRPR